MRELGIIVHLKNTISLLDTIPLVPSFVIISGNILKAQGGGNRHDRTILTY